MARQNTQVQQQGVTSFFRGVRQEMKKVVWPTKNELVRYTIVVLITVAFISLLIMAVDFVF
ncbi:MAG: preprotein translocase subunit SecE, partial [Negativicoccus succinicivorans]|nr:preprotein translocase subunit SecE [Negativicoccus succinicivorans]